MLRGFFAAAVAAAFAWVPATAATVVLDRTDPIYRMSYQFSFEAGRNYLIEMTADVPAYLTWDGTMDLRSRLIDAETGAVVQDNFSDTQVPIGSFGPIISYVFKPRLPAPQGWTNGTYRQFYIGRYGIVATFYANSTDVGTFHTRITEGVPEPASWAMMVAGFAGIGAVSRKRPARSPTPSWPRGTAHR